MRYVAGVRQAKLEGAQLGAAGTAFGGTAPALGGGASELLRQPAAEPSAQGSEATAVPAERVAALDALRGLMALAVVVYHLGVLTRAFSGPLRTAVVLLGVYSVEGFFVISGFCFFHLYAGTALQGAELRRFHRKRFLRIAPVFYLAIALSLATDPMFRAVCTPLRLLENLSLTFGLFHPNHALVIGGWSIGLEYVFYLALPVLLWLGRRPLALYVLAVVLALWSLPFVFDKVQATEGVFHRFDVYVELPNHAFLFVLGALIAEVRRRVHARMPLLVVLAASCALCWLAVRQQPPFADHIDVMVGYARVRYLLACAGVVLLFAFAAWPSGWIARPFAHLGELSYSLYLMHPIAWVLLAKLAPALGSPALQVAAGMAAALALAELVHRTLERPLMRLARR
jgi:peptidoglycan/LPS O-acetylase OafA/YrhL